MESRIERLEAKVRSLKQTIADSRTPDLSGVKWDGTGVPPGAIAQALGSAIIREIRKVRLARGNL